MIPKPQVAGSIPAGGATKVDGVEQIDAPKLRCGIRLHDLRHTHASHSSMAGVNVKVVSERLGVRR